MPSIRDGISLELSHLHAPDRLVHLEGMSGARFEFNSAELAAMRTSIDRLEAGLRARFECGAAPITRLALLDDVHAREAQRKGGDSWRWELFTGVSRDSIAQGTGGEVYDESAFVHRGRALQAIILDRAASEGIKISANRRIHIPTSSGIVAVSLCGFKGVEDPTHPSCSVLDLAWTEWRSQQFEGTITTLPTGYEKQQLQVAALAALMNLPRRESVRAVFLDSSGQPAGELRFGELSLLR